ncbi:MAG: M15 family metallopeptidase, partial [Oscillospiraceae bacterium]
MKKVILIFMLTTVLVLSACHTINDSLQSSQEESTTGATADAATESTSKTTLTTTEATTESTAAVTTQATEIQTTAAANDEAIAAFIVLPHFLEENAADYVDYQQQHPDLEAKTVVTYVNIGLNRPFYTQIKTISDTDSIMIFCNKYYALSADYEPTDLTQLPAEYSLSGRTLYLRQEAAEAFVELCAAAKAEGFTIIGQSAYRSYSYQKGLYDNYVLTDGQAAADTYSARPGHSEHQTGLAIDVKNATHSYN